jgi:hypothetical protein
VIIKREVNMKVKELKKQIVIDELKPNCRYICLVNPQYVLAETLPKLKNIWYVVTYDVEKSVKFVSVPKRKWWEFWK